MSTALALLNNNDTIGWTSANPPGETADFSIGRVSASVLGLGVAGATNPVLTLDQATASAITGLKIVSAASGAGLAVSVTLC